MKFQSILVPTDFSYNAGVAVRVAVRLAHTVGGTLHVLHVQEGSDLRTAVKEALIQPGMSDTQIHEAVSELQDMRFSELLAGLDAQPPIQCVVAQGAPQRVIIEYAEETAPDLIVVGLRGTSVWDALRTALMGSVAEAMIRKSPCPVLVVRPDHRIS